MCILCCGSNRLAAIWKCWLTDTLSCLATRSRHTFVALIASRHFWAASLWSCLRDRQLCKAGHYRSEFGAAVQYVIRLPAKWILDTFQVEKCKYTSEKVNFFICATIFFRDVTEPAKIRIRQMRISCAKSIGCGCGFVMRSKLVPAITATAIQLSHLELNSYKPTSSE